MEVEYCLKQYLVNYNNLIDEISLLFEDDDHRSFILILNKEKKAEKWSRGMKLYKTLTTEYYNSFLESKVKLFSHKDEHTKNISMSLFGDVLSLKKIFNNRTEKVKTKLWYNLHYMILMIETAQKNRDKVLLEKMIKLIGDEEKKIKELEEKEKMPKPNAKTKPREIVKNLLGKNDYNEETNEMIDDIIQSFENSMNNSSNPIAGVMEISEKISVKYKEKIDAGIIQIDKIMDNISDKFPGLKDILQNLKSKSEPTETKETIVIDENFSTSQVKQGERKEDKKYDPSLVKMLKFLDSMGGLSNLTQGGMPDMKKMLSGLMGDKKSDPKMEKLFNMMSDMENPDNIDKIKDNMNDFLATELGVDISKLDSEIKKSMETIEQATKEVESNEVIDDDEAQDE